VLQQVVVRIPPRPRSLRATIPRDLETICLHTIEKVPARRYDSALDMANDLRRYTSDVPILARRPSLPELCWRWLCRYPAAAVFIVLIAAMVAVASSKIASLQKSNYKLHGLRSVYITTNPPGASVALVPLDPNTNEPNSDPTAIIRPRGSTPLTVEVPPSTYLVEAVLPGGGVPAFAEAQRTVSAGAKKSDGAARANEHQGLDPDTCRWSPIEIVSQNGLIKKMVEVPVHEDLRRRSPWLPTTFYVAAQQTSPSRNGQPNPEVDHFLNRTDEGEPCITYQGAIQWAESNHLRLPSAAEYGAMLAAVEAGEARYVDSGAPATLDDLFDDSPEFSTTIKAAPSIVGNGVTNHLRKLHLLEGYKDSGALNDALPWADGALLAASDTKSAKISIRGVRSATPRFVKP